jgi:hypothetical protein
MPLLALAILSLTRLPAQTLNGNVTVDYTPSLSQIYAGQDPLKGRAEYMPPESTGKCVPAVAGWILVYQSKTTCYYFAPFKTPLQGTVITPKEAGKYRWARCSAHPWDPTLIVCYGKPKPLWSSNGRGPYSGIAVVDPCHPTYDMSTPQGRSAAQQSAAQTKQACDEERCKHNPELEVCSGPPPPYPVANKPRPLTPSAPKPVPANPLAGAGAYVNGLTDGLGDCIKSFGDLLVGAAYFAEGDFVNAARVWGLTPGQSVTLKTIAMELSQQVVGKGVTPYLQGRIAGRRICNYVLVPPLAKAGGNALRSVLPKVKFVNPIKGEALLDAATNTPKELALQGIETATGPKQLGEYIGGGAFGKVFRLIQKTPRVIKLGTSEIGSAESFPRQRVGALILKDEIKVKTPEIYDVEAGTPTSPAVLIMDDVFQKWPGAKQFSKQEFQALPEAQSKQVLSAVVDVYKKIANKGYIAADLHINNMMFIAKKKGGLEAIVHDADMIMTGPQLQEALADGASIPGGVVRMALKKAGLQEILNQAFTPQSMMDALF